MASFECPKLRELEAEIERLKCTGLPAVWVRSNGCCDNYIRCDENGEYENCHPVSIREIRKWFDGIAEVRVWEESNADLETDSSGPWIYVIWSDVPRCLASIPTREQIEGLLSGVTDNRNHLRGIPLFGVRRLMKREQYDTPYYTDPTGYTGAFYNGNYIKGSFACGDAAKGSIKRVLTTLVPAIPAVTLADLETV